MTPTVYVTEAPSVTEPLGLSTYARIDLAVVIARAKPGDTSLWACIESVLTGLGKGDHVTAGTGHRSDVMPQLPLWLTAHRTRLVVIANAQAWTPALIEDTTRYLYAGGASVLYVADHGRGDDVADALIGYAPTRVPFADIGTLMPAEPDTDPVTVSAVDWNTVAVPESEWPTFRYDARRLLEPDVFAAIDAHYVRALDACRAALTTITEPGEDSTRALLVRLIDDTTKKAEAIAVFRAAQAAYFEAGYNLRVDVHEALTLLAKSKAVAFTPDDWRSLRAYRVPARAAACVLYGAQLPATDIANFTLADADKAIAAEAANGIALPADAVAMLRAARMERSLDDAADGDPLISHSNVASILTAAAKDLGIIVASASQRHSKHTARIWNYRVGFHLQAIGA